jgi:hypothetical protein
MNPMSKYGCKFIALAAGFAWAASRVAGQVRGIE